MDPYVVVHLLVGIVLLCGSVGLSIAVTVKGRKVQTWTPFIWSAVVGILMIPTSALNAAGPSDLRLIVACAGALLLVGSLITAMLISIGDRPVKTWTPLIWGAVFGILLL